MAKTTKIAPASKPATASTKDKGAVKVGGAGMRFANTTDKGVVHVGGAGMRF